MVELVRPKVPSVIYAEASVRSVGGVSLFTSPELITSQNVANFYSDPQLVNLAVQRLSAEGFEVLEHNQITITIAAAPQVYERVFRTKIVAKERFVIKQLGQPTTATFLDSTDTDIPGLIDVEQSPLTDVIEGVALNEPVYYFDTVLPLCPKKPYWHLDVPQDISRGLNADQAHDQGFTGRRVKVAMVDSGWYRHPFFVNYGYRATVVLSAGTTDPEIDEHGHGTGESANLFAVAPDVEFTMVKTNFINSVGAFKKAVSMHVDIISCSWGSNQQYSLLSASDKALAAAIADAVNQGIIVICAAGNSHWGFPGQHPDVISAGGVYLHQDGTLEASDYASGFRSNIYPGRNVPDVCGLVGKQPKAAYIILPVPPGSIIDSTSCHHGGLQGGKHPDGDETEIGDGWAAFSGTSAAAPQLAGICALMKQANPDLSPKQARHILQNTSRDVTQGNCHQNTGGHKAGIGFDLATGSGLADAYQATMMARLETEKIDPKSLTLEENPQELFRTQTQEEIMDSILKSKLDDLLWEFDKKLQEMMKANPGMQEVELSLSGINFVPRSPVTKAAAVLREKLDNKSEHIKVRLSAAEGLLKLGRYQESVMQFLTDEALNEVENSAAKEPEKTDLRSRIIEALGEIGSETACTGCSESEEMSTLFNRTSKIVLCNNKRYKECSDGKLVPTNRSC